MSLVVVILIIVFCVALVKVFFVYKICFVDNMF